MKDLTTIGIDIAKNFIQIHGANDKGKALFKKRLPRGKFILFMANLPKCLVGMEACGGAHYWAQELTKLGFETKLMSPRKVKKFVENNKNDAKDENACAEDEERQNMIFVPIKTKAQIKIQAINLKINYYVKNKNELINMK